jgi:hypothetical protein
VTKPTAVRLCDLLQGLLITVYCLLPKLPPSAHYPFRLRSSDYSPHTTHLSLLTTNINIIAIHPHTTNNSLLTSHFSSLPRPFAPSLPRSLSLLISLYSNSSLLSGRQPAAECLISSMSSCRTGLSATRQALTFSWMKK